MVKHQLSNIRIQVFPLNLKQREPGHKGKEKFFETKMPTPAYCRYKLQIGGRQMLFLINKNLKHGFLFTGFTATGIIVPAVFKSFVGGLF